MDLVFKNVWEISVTKSYCPVSLPSVVPSRKVLGLIDQLQTFWQLHVNMSWATRAMTLIYLRLLTGFDMLVFFTNLNLMQFQVGYFAILHFFSIIDCFGWFWMQPLNFTLKVSNWQGKCCFSSNPLSKNIVQVIALWNIYLCFFPAFYKDLICFTFIFFSFIFFCRYCSISIQH